MKYKYNFDDKKNVKKKRIIFCIVFIIVTLIFVAFAFRNSSNSIINKVSNIITYPINAVSNAISLSTKNIGEYFSNKKKLNDQNEKLEKENTELKLKLLETEKILNENTSLKEMLDIKKSYQHFNIKLGKIIYREHDNWTKTFTVDMGLDDGIKVNQAVVHKDGLVGYVSNVTNTTSTVTTILDPASAVSVKISTLNEPAILQGDLSLKSQNKLKLNFIQLDSEVSISDILYTSGLGDIYPSSIPVGKITEIISKKNNINRYAIVEPIVDINKISEVGIIIN